MKRNLRFYFALFFAKGTALVLKLIGRKGTSMPGSWAIILCPDFIGRMEKPEKIIGITGTNGKTTVANMIEDILQMNGEDFICNREGSNVSTGIASALIANTTFLGKPKKNLAVFELDERSSVRVFPYLEPDILLVTNLFRDSYRRNAHTEFIFDILNGSIPQGTKLVLNGDDPLCSELRPTGERCFFGMNPLDFESGDAHNLVCDGAVCPRCSAPLTYDFTRYHHIGLFHCGECGYTAPKKAYTAVSANREKALLTVRIGKKEYSLKLLDQNPTNMYNQLSAMAVLCEFGYTPKKILDSFRNMQITESRLNTAEAGGKTVVCCLAKGQNPVACSRTFDNARTLPGRKCVILFIDDHFDALHSVENIAWLYDTDFEFLNDDSITQIIVSGARHQDTNLRLLLAGVQKERIRHMDATGNVPEAIDLALSDTFVIYYDVYLLDNAEKTKAALLKKLEGEAQ